VAHHADRRFLLPWEIEDNGACFIVRDHSGRVSPICITRTSRGAGRAANLLTRDKARRIAINMAEIPELTKRHQY
jgi:hypothetical protein